MTNFTSLIQVVGIALELCRFLDSADIIRLIRVSRDCRDAFHDNKYQLFNIHGDSVREVSVFSLSTVGVTWMLSVDGKGVIASSANPNGFAFTVTSWTGI